MLADEVHLVRFVRARGEVTGLRQQADLQRQKVAEDAGDGHDDVDPRAAELFERDEARASEPAVGVEARTRADQRQRLADRAAFALEIVRAPENDRDAFGERMAVRRITREHHLGLTRAVGDRERARDPIWVESMQVPAGRQDRRVAKQVAARRRARRSGRRARAGAPASRGLRQADDRGAASSAKALRVTSVAGAPNAAIAASSGRARRKRLESREVAGQPDTSPRRARPASRRARRRPAAHPRHGARAGSARIRVRGSPSRA